jgi:hypothetical protein
MASEKKPSIYYDRGTIGSSDELDEYGVWVKGEPQDLSSVGAESQESSDLPDPDLPDMGDLPDFSASGDDLSDEDTVSLDEDLELPDIDFEDGPERDDDAESGDGSTGDDSSEGEEDTTDFGESAGDFDLDSGESGDSGEAAATDFELNEFPEPDFADFTESPAEDGETLSGDEAEDLGFVEVSMDAGEDAVTVDDEPVQALDGPESGKKPEFPKETKPAPPDLSTQLLMRIADELASIRTELSTLKGELAGIKAESASADTGDARSGFFDEEDDEKIALTGDELDNILNTADFTEEAGSDATEKAEADAAEDFGIQEAEDDSSGPFQEITETPVEKTEEEAGELSFDDLTNDLDLDMGLEEKDLDELEGEINFDKMDQPDQADQAAGEAPADQEALLEEPVEFDITMDDDGGDLALENSFEEIPEEIPAGEAGQDEPESLPDLEDKDSEDLRRLREEGAKPMTPAPEPEDASFLEEDPLAFSEFEEESLDLSNAVIDEPDLSSEIQENPLEEPSLDDISIDLDLDEEISLDEDTEDGIGGTEEAESPEEEIELPVSDENLEIGDEPESDEEELEDSADLAVIPEGFVVEAEDSGTPAIDEGEEAFSETADEVEAEEAGEETLPQVQEIEEIREDEGGIPSHLKQELKTVLSYMDQLLESLPDEKIEEFAKSEYFDTYKKLFKELGLV